MFAADLKLRPGYGSGSNAVFPVSKRRLECQYRQVTPHTTRSAASSGRKRGTVSKSTA